MPSAWEEDLIDAFRALGEPLRMRVVLEIAQSEEVACTELEQMFPVTKSTISYHIKILSRARIIRVRKSGRYYFYRLREDVDERFPGLLELLREPKP